MSSSSIDNTEQEKLLLRRKSSNETSNNEGGDDHHGDNDILIDEVLIRGGSNYSSLSSSSSASFSSSVCELSSMTLGERIDSGKTLVSISNLVTRPQVNALAQASLQAAADLQHRQKTRFHENDYNIINNNQRRVSSDIDTEDVSGRLLIRMPMVLDAQTRENDNDGDNGVNSQIQYALPESISVELKGILQQIFEVIDEKICPSLKTTLFRSGIDDDTTLTMANEEKVSLARLFMTMS